MKEITRFYKCSVGDIHSGLMDRCLIIYEGKRDYRVELWRSGTIGWKSYKCHLIASKRYNKKDVDIETIKKEWGF